MTGGTIQMHSFVLWGECIGACVLSIVIYAELIALLMCTTDGKCPAGCPSPCYKPSWYSGPVCAPLCFHLFSLQCLTLLRSLSVTLANITETSYFSTVKFYCWISPLPFPTSSHACPWKERSLRNFADNAEQGVVADVLKTGASVQRELEKLGDLANRNSLKLSSEMSKILHWGQQNPVA